MSKNRKTHRRQCTVFIRSSTKNKLKSTAFLFVCACASSLTSFQEYGFWMGWKQNALLFSMHFLWINQMQFSFSAARPIVSNNLKWSHNAGVVPEMITASFTQSANTFRAFLHNHSVIFNWQDAQWSHFYMGNGFNAVNAAFLMNLITFCMRIQMTKTLWLKFKVT